MCLICNNVYTATVLVEYNIYCDDLCSESDSIEMFNLIRDKIKRY